MSFMTILECRFILLISDIPGEAVAVDLAHTGDRNEGFIVDTQYSPLDSVQVPVAGDTVYDILVFMHVSTYSLKKSCTESHTEKLLIHFVYFLREDHHLHSALLHYDQLIHENTVDQGIQDPEDNSVRICNRYLDEENKNVK